MEVENKRNNILVIIFVITTIIATNTALYFALNNNVLSGESSTLAEDNKGNAVNNEPTIKEVEKIVEVEKAKMLDYDNTKSKNVTETDNYDGSIMKLYHDETNEFVLLIKKDGTAQVRVGSTDYPISNLKGKVKDGMLGSYYQGAEISAYLLLENGTVQTVTGFDIFKQTGFEGKELVSGVKDIIRFETVLNNGGKRLPIAIDKDGYYYSLY